MTFLALFQPFFAASTSAGFLNKSIAVAASVFAATIIPFCPMQTPTKGEALSIRAVYKLIDFP